MEFLLIGTTIGSEPDWFLDENITARPNDLLLHRVWFNHRTRSRPAGRRDCLQEGYSRRHQVDFLLSLATIITFQDFFGLQSLKIDQKLGFTCIGAACRASIQTTTQLWDPPNRGQYSVHASLRNRHRFLWFMRHKSSAAFSLIQNGKSSSCVIITEL
jgi:hypothetical protein